MKSTEKVAVRKKPNGTYVLTERAVPGFRLADNVNAAKSYHRSTVTGRHAKRSPTTGRYVAKSDT